MTRTVLGTAIGILAGAVVAFIVEINLVIFSGIERGYEATLPDMFAENRLIGVLAVAILVAGPVAGGIWGFRMASRRRPAGTP